MDTILNILDKQAAEQPQSTAFTFHHQQEQDSITFAQLETNSKALALSMRNYVKPGERAILLCPAGLEYIQLFFACLYAGIVAVPLYPPHIKQRSDRIRSVMNDSGATVAFTSNSYYPKLKTYLEQSDDYSQCTLLNPEQLMNQAPYSGELCYSELAFLQYTSGSTGAPKGVQITHQNILANLRALIERTQCTQQDVFVNWLPLFHDLGLVNTILLPVYLGSHSVIMTPSHFAQKPGSWFEAIGKYKGTICGAPNFAYDLACERLNDEQISQYDLSSWRIAFNAAEPINAATLTQFATRFAPAGFNKHAFYAAYGMAEATVFVTGRYLDSEDAVQAFHRQSLSQNLAVKKMGASSSVVSCGYPAANQTCLIVDPVSHQELEAGQLGEIWLKGDSMSPGYWNKPELNREVFNATLESGDGGYVRTGDIGFIYQQALFVCGRIKDIFIIHGQNYYPTDIEICCFTSHDKLIENAAIAFTADTSKGEQVFVIQEVKPVDAKGDRAESLIVAAQRNIAEQYELSAQVLLVKKGTLPRTSSGKVQRARCKHLFQSGELALIGSTTAPVAKGTDQPATSDSGLSSDILSVFRRVFKQPGMAATTSFFEFGADSLQVGSLINALETELRIQVSFEWIYEHSSAAELAESLTDVHFCQSRQAIPDFTGGSTGKLSSAQRRIWFINQVEKSKTLMNVPGAFRIAGKLNVPLFSQSIDKLVQRHEIFRTTYHFDGTDVTQSIAPFTHSNYLVTDISRFAPSEQAVKLAERLKFNQGQAFDLAMGPVYRFELIIVSQDEFYFVFNIHHIATDAASMSVLLDELKQVYLGKTLAPAGSYLHYAHVQTEQLPDTLAKHTEYWSTQLKDCQFRIPLPTDKRAPEKPDYQAVLSQLTSLNRCWIGLKHSMLS